MSWGRSNGLLKFLEVRWTCLRVSSWCWVFYRRLRRQHKTSLSLVATGHFNRWHGLPITFIMFVLFRLRGNFHPFVLFLQGILSLPLIHHLHFLFFWNTRAWICIVVARWMVQGSTTNVDYSLLIWKIDKTSRWQMQMCTKSLFVSFWLARELQVVASLPETSISMSLHSVWR